MKTVYLLWWDNGEEYEDHRDDVEGIFTSREAAESYLAKLMLAGKQKQGRYSISERECDPKVEA